jgi:hypothetical protein
MLEYTNDKCIPLKRLYEKFVKFCYPLKQKSEDEDVRKAMKAILTILWGAHAEKNTVEKVKYTNKILPIQIEQEEGFYVREIQVVSQNTIKIIYSKYENIYRGQFPRNKSLITALGRAKMYDLLHDRMDEVKLILTDGFLTTKKFENTVLKKDAALGDLVYEGYYKDITLHKVNTSYNKNYTFVKA